MLTTGYKRAFWTSLLPLASIFLVSTLWANDMPTSFESISSIGVTMSNRNPQITHYVDDDGMPHIFTIPSSTTSNNLCGASGRVIEVYKDENGTWSSRCANLHYDYYDVAENALSVVRDDTNHVTWLAARQKYSSSYHAIYFYKRADGEVNWTYNSSWRSGIFAYNNGGIGSQMSIGGPPNKRILAISWSLGTTTPKLLIANVTNGNFSVIEDLSGSYGKGYWYGVAVDTSGDVHYLYGVQNVPQYQKWSVNSFGTGASGSSAENITNTTDYYNFHTKIIVDPYTKEPSVFLKKSNYIYITTKSDSGWSSPRQIVYMGCCGAYSLDAAYIPDSNDEYRDIAVIITNKNGYDWVNYAERNSGYWSKKKTYPYFADDTNPSGWDRRALSLAVDRTGYVSISGLRSDSTLNFVTNKPANSPPTSEAGSNQSNLAEGTTISLSGTCTDSDFGDILTGTWTQTSGTSCTSRSNWSGTFGTSPLTVNATCVVPNVSANETLIFQLECGDGTTSSTDTVNISVNAKPSASGKTISTNEDTSITIAGLGGSDPNGDTLTTSIVTEPSHGTLNGADSNPTYTPNANFNGVDSFTFKVNDGVQDSDPATVTISVGSVNDTPVAIAEASSQSITPPVTVTLDGSSSSDADGDELSYTWTQISGPNVTLSDASTANPTFSPTISGTYIFSLTVNDGTINSTPDTISITVHNAAPSVSAGQDQTAYPGDTVDVNCSATDANNDRLTYAWTKVSGPAISDLNFPASGASQTFTVPMGHAFGTHIVLRCTAIDGNGGSNSDTITITIGAKAPDGTIAASAEDKHKLHYRLSANFHLYNSDSATYSWQVVDAPDDASTEISNASSSTAAFSGDKVGTYKIRICVSDGSQQTCKDDNLEVENESPVITVADDKDEIAYTSNSTDDIDLSDVTTVTDANNDAVSTSWELVSGPATPHISNNKLDTTNYKYKRGTYQIRQKATDENGATTYSDPILITMPNNPPEPPSSIDVSASDGTTVTNDNINDVMKYSAFDSNISLSNIIFSDMDGDNIAYSWQTEDDGLELISVGSGEISLRNRRAGTRAITATASDGHNGTSQISIRLYMPPPPWHDNQRIIITNADVSTASTQTITGQLDSLVEPIVEINGIKAQDVKLASAASTCESKAKSTDDSSSTEYDTYTFTATGVPTNGDPDSMNINVYTDVDGEDVLLKSKSMSIGEGTSTTSTGSDSGEMSTGGYSLKGGGCSLISANNSKEDSSLTTMMSLLMMAIISLGFGRKRILYNLTKRNL